MFKPERLVWFTDGNEVPPIVPGSGEVLSGDNLMDSVADFAISRLEDYDMAAIRAYLDADGSDLDAPNVDTVKNILLSLVAMEPMVEVDDVRRYLASIDSVNDADITNLCNLIAERYVLAQSAAEATSLSSAASPSGNEILQQLDAVERREYAGYIIEGNPDVIINYLSDAYDPDGNETYMDIIRDYDDQGDEEENYLFTEDGRQKVREALLAAWGDEAELDERQRVILENIMITDRDNVMAQGTYRDIINQIKATDELLRASRDPNSRVVRAGMDWAAGIGLEAFENVNTLPDSQRALFYGSCLAGLLYVYMADNKFTKAVRWGIKAAGIGFISYNVLNVACVAATGRGLLDNFDQFDPGNAEHLANHLGLNPEDPEEMLTATDFMSMLTDSSLSAVSFSELMNRYRDGQREFSLAEFAPGQNVFTDSPFVEGTPDERFSRVIAAVYEKYSHSDRSSMLYSVWTQMTEEDADIRWSTAMRALFDTTIDPGAPDFVRSFITFVSDEVSGTVDTIIENPFVVREIIPPLNRAYDWSRVHIETTIRRLPFTEEVAQGFRDAIAWLDFGNPDEVSEYLAYQMNTNEDLDNMAGGYGRFFRQAFESRSINSGRVDGRGIYQDIGGAAYTLVRVRLEDRDNEYERENALYAAYAQALERFGNIDPDVDLTRINIGLMMGAEKPIAGSDAVDYYVGFRAIMPDSLYAHTDTEMVHALNLGSSTEQLEIENIDMTRLLYLRLLYGVDSNDELQPLIRYVNSQTISSGTRFSYLIDESNIGEIWSRACPGQSRDVRNWNFYVNQIVPLVQEHLRAHHISGGYLERLYVDSIDSQAYAHAIALTSDSMRASLEIESTDSEAILAHLSSTLEEYYEERFRRVAGIAESGVQEFDPNDTGGINYVPDVGIPEFFNEGYRDSVVTINRTSIEPIRIGGREIPPGGFGTGFLVYKNDDIAVFATAYHVVQDPAASTNPNVSINLPNVVSPIDGTVIAHDEGNDLALISVPYNDQLFEHMNAIAVGTGPEVADPQWVLGSPTLEADLVRPGIAAGQPEWASVDEWGDDWYVLSQETVPGWSGSPVIDAEGNVSGVLVDGYNQADSYNQFRSIAIDASVLRALMDGANLQ